jgi:hypothetical protein
MVLKGINWKLPIILQSRQSAMLPSNVCNEKNNTILFAVRFIVAII